MPDPMSRNWRIPACTRKRTARCRNARLARAVIRMSGTRSRSWRADSRASAQVGGAPPELCLVVGDEELLATRAVAQIGAAARAADPEADMRELEAAALVPGELAELLSPSLFGGRRVLVVRNAQDARKDATAALLAYARHPDPDVCLVVVHAGGAKGKALADGLRAAGALVISAGRLTRHKERVDFVRDEVRRVGGRCPENAAEAPLAAVGNDLRELAAACTQLMADTGGKVSAEP